MVVNPHNGNCQICDGFNSLYHADSFEKEIRLPNLVGDGYCRRIALKPSVEISIVDMTFFGDMAIDGRGGDRPSFYDLSFCLEGSFRWRTKEKNLELEAQRGDSLMLCGETAYGLSNIDKGQHFSYVNIKMREDFIAGLLSLAGAGNLTPAALCSPTRFQKGETSFSAKRILYDILNCRLSRGVKKIYLEAKITELLAVYMDETVFENSVLLSPPDLSKEDIDGLWRAKSILDADIAGAPSLSHLARLANLNEYKLKRSFKALYGQPVHAYIIDRRLENAQHLLETGDVTVTEAAQLVGFNDLGRFAEKFRKKFGVNPSEYKKTS